MRSRTLGERESGTARLEEAVAAYRAALEERTRERVPLDWAATQNNLGNCALERSASGRAGRRGSKKRSPPIARRSGKDARAGSARLGDDAEQSRRCASDARRAGERDGAARGGGRRLSRGAGRKGRASGFRSTGRRRRTISALRFERSASGRAGRRGSRRRSRPIARRCRNGRASGFRSTGRRASGVKGVAHDADRGPHE